MKLYGYYNPSIYIGNKHESINSRYMVDSLIKGRTDYTFGIPSLYVNLNHNHNLIFVL